ncbi:hypothetical protein [Mammaliicoccus stepanovicii]|nr:hypothetical protein [Mammaliicoccus stepanovicii]
MMEWLIGLLGEDVLFNYLAFGIHYFIPILLTLLFVYLQMQANIKLHHNWFVKSSTEIDDQYIFEWIIPILRWRIRCLSKSDDEEDVCPIY